MNDEYFNLAFIFSKKAFLLGEVPVGAVIVKDNEIISYACNQKERDKSVFSHAELIAIKEAEKKLSNWRLDGCDLYVTLDPCPMCASAIKQARISRVYSALESSYKNNTKIIKEIFKADNTNPKVYFYSNQFPFSSRKILNEFFSRQRSKYQ